MYKFWDLNFVYICRYMAAREHPRQNKNELVMDVE